MTTNEPRAALHGLLESLSDADVAAILPVVRTHAEHHEYVNATLEPDPDSDARIEWEMEYMPS